MSETFQNPPTDKERKKYQDSFFFDTEEEYEKANKMYGDLDPNNIPEPIGGYVADEICIQEALDHMEKDNVCYNPRKGTNSPKYA